MGPRRVDSALLRRARGRLARPEDIADGTRWLFAGLVVASVLVSLPAPLSSARGVALPLAVVSTAVLTATWTGVYLSGRFALWCDVVLAVAICGFALASPSPTVVFPFVFAGVWFGALYGTTWRSLTRCALYYAGVAMTLPLWHLIAGHTVAPAPELVLGSAPTLVLTVFVGRYLAVGLSAREQGLRRDRVLADLGAQILAVTDADAIRAAARAAAAGICAATPGLRVLHAVRDGMVLRVELVVGEFATPPGVLPRTTIVTSPPPGQPIVDPVMLDSAVGTALAWTCLQLDVAQGDGWTLIGAPRRPSDSAILAVRSLIVMLALALRQSDVHQELSVQARVDSLTGLANRAAFTAALSDALARSTAFNPVHLLFIDLDDFKDVNDAFGHQAGDEVLAEVGARLRTCTRNKDVCARLGGDEFAVILVDTAAQAATEIAQRMVHALTEPFGAGGHTVRIGASIGLAASPTARIADSPESDSVNVAELAHQADVAMYAAKANGKAQVQWFDYPLMSADSAAALPLASSV